MGDPQRIVGIGLVATPPSRRGYGGVSRHTNNSSNIDCPSHQSLGKPLDRCPNPSDFFLLNYAKPPPVNSAN